MAKERRSNMDVTSDESAKVDKNPANEALTNEEKNCYAVEEFSEHEN